MMSIKGLFRSIALHIGVSLLFITAVGAGESAEHPPFDPGNTNLVWIPPGTFMMGSPSNEVDRRWDEGPQTEVTIRQGFWMGKHEVTQAEYQEVTGKNPSFFHGVRYGVEYGIDLSRPVDSASWKQATNYCAELTARERAAERLPGDYVYRLPTEAEWEYACRAGTTTIFSYDAASYTNLGKYAWFRTNSNLRTHQVGLKQPNRWGLYDMHGNVWEYCIDLNGPYLGGRVIDPCWTSKRIAQGERQSAEQFARGGGHYGAGRVARGGGFNQPPGCCRSAQRGIEFLIMHIGTLTPGLDMKAHYRTQEWNAGAYGFRVVLAPVRPQ